MEDLIPKQLIELGFEFDSASKAKGGNLTLADKKSVIDQYLKNNDLVPDIKSALQRMLVSNAPESAQNADFEKLEGFIKSSQGTQNIINEENTKLLKGFLKLSDLTAKEIKENPKLTNEERYKDVAKQQMSQLINLQDFGIQNKDRTFSITEEEYKNLETKAKELGLELKSTNVDGKKGDRLDVLLNNQLVASVGVVFANDTIGRKL